MKVLFYNKICKDVNKKVFFFAIFLLLGITLLLSGCIKFSEDSDDEGISFSDAMLTCADVSKPPSNYPICGSTFNESQFPGSKNCPPVFSSQISEGLKFEKLSILTETYANNMLENLFEGWKNAEDIAYAYSKVNKSCDSLLNNELSNYKNDIKLKAGNLDNYNIEYMKSFTTTVFSAKKDLIDLNIDLLKGTKVYTDYIELNNIINEYMKETGTKIETKTTENKEAITFYKTYYLNEESQKKINETISTLNSNAQNISFTSDAGGWLVGAGAVGTVIAFPELVAIIPLITSGFSVAKSIASTVSSVLESAQQMTDLSDWYKLNDLKSMIQGYANAHGPFATADKYFFSLLKDIDSHILEIEKENKEKEASVKKKLTALKKTISDQKLAKSNFDVLYERYQVVSSSQDLVDKTNTYEQQLLALPNAKLGERYFYLNKLDSQLDQLQEDLDIYLDTDYTSIISLCKADILSVQQNIESLPGSQDKQILQTYSKLFLSENKDEKQMLYCAEFFKVYNPNLSYDCLSAHSNLKSNMGLSSDVISEAECSSAINSEMANAFDSEIYKTLSNLFKQIELRQKMLSKIVVRDNCVSYSDFVYWQNTFFGFYKTSAFTNNKSLSVLLTEKDAPVFSQKIANAITEFDDKFKTTLECVMKTNYALDLENENLTFNNYLGNFAVNFKFGLPVYNSVESIETNGGLVSANIKNGIANLEFNSISSDMSYKIKTKESEPEYKIQKLLTTPELGELEQKICLSSVTENKQYFDLPTSSEKIIDLKTYDDSKSLQSYLESDKLVVLFDKIKQSEKCFYASYFLEAPFTISNIVSDIQETSNATKYFYDLEIKNELSLFVPDAKIILPNTLNTLQKEIDAKDNFGSKYTISASQDSLLFNLKNVAPQVPQILYYFVSVSNADENLDTAVSKLKEDIDKMKTKDIPQEKIDKIEKEIEDLSLITDKKEKAQKIESIKKEVNKLIADTSTQNTLKIRYEKALKNLENFKQQYLDAKSSLEKSYAVILPDTVDFKLLDATISEAKQKYSSGDISGAVKQLEAFKTNAKSLENAILSLLKSLQNNASDLEKTAKKTGKYDKLQFESLDKISYNITELINAGRYNDALTTLGVYKKQLDTISSDVSSQTNSLAGNILATLAKYNSYKKQLDSLWTTYGSLDSSISSDKYSMISKYGVTFSFTPSNLNSLKTKIASTTKQIVNLDKLQREFEYNKDNSDYVTKFDTKSFEDFFYDVDALEETANLYEKELRTKAETSISFAEDSLGVNPPAEFYKAKNLLDENKFVDSIYMSKIALLGQKGDYDNEDNSWYLYAGLAFILLLVILVVIFGKKLSFFGKGNTKVETYYSVDKEE